MRKPDPDSAVSSSQVRTEFQGLSSEAPPCARRAPSTLASAFAVVFFGAAWILPQAASAKVVDVIEFYNTKLDHYFVTSLKEEIDKLDSGEIKGWTRTGLSFRAQDKLINGLNPVCRYYIPGNQGDSHFFSASVAECAKIRSKFPSFVNESDSVMYIGLPHPKTGACPGTHQPVYRVWDKRLDSNHRYMTDRALRDQMVAQGWVAEGYGDDAVAMCSPKSAEEPDPVTAALPPPCKGVDSRVSVPDGPHGMYVWSPGKAVLPYLQKDVIGKDPTLCGASLVIAWADVETSQGVYNWEAVTTAAQPFTDAGLTVNLLFADATEGTDTVTPLWVTNSAAMGGAGVPSVSGCSAGPVIPVYWDPTYESLWKTFIAAAIKQFSYGNSIAPSVGYMRFATAGGAEALAPPGYQDGGACQKKWEDAGYSYDVWNQHEANIITAMGSQSTDKQIIASLPNVSGGPSIYSVSNLGAAVAVPLKVGLSFENLGTSNVAAANYPPAPCDPQATIVNLHWCQAYTTYVGQVPLAMQPITSTDNTATQQSYGITMDISNLLQYALKNNIQIFELYPQEWLQADSPTWSGFVMANQAKYQQALQQASQTLGATNGK